MPDAIRGGPNRNPLRRYGTVFGLVFLFLLFLGGSMWVTSTPAFCRTCHEMRPEYYTWEVSDHSQVTCVRCHIGPGTENFARHKISALNQVYLHVTGRYLLPLELKEPLSNETCLQCHTDQWERTASGDIKMPHKTHLAQGVACTDCHLGVAHGRIAERTQTIDGQFLSWSDARGRSNMVRPFRISGMKECMDCHTARDASRQCEACHKKLIRPENHLAASWASEHGKQALADIDACDQCHSYSLGMVRVRASNPVAEYARTNTFCSKCHVTRPEGHDQAWSYGHGAPARAMGVAGCQVCHESTPPRKAQGVARSYCNQCHQKAHDLPGTTHPIPLPPGPPTTACARCHSLRACGKCHTNLNPPPPERAAAPSEAQAQTRGG